MTLLRDLIENTRHSLSGFDASREAVLELASTVNASALTIPVDDTGVQSGAAGAAKGFIELDLEIVRIKEVDTSGVALLATTSGRGQRGSVATTHNAGTEIRVNPSFPAYTIAREINGVLNEIYPQIYAVKDHETEFPSDFGAIDVPADCTGIIAVFVQDEVRSDEWVREDRWAWQPDSSTTGKGLRVGGTHRTGLGIRIVYAAPPTPFDLTGALTQDFTTVTGLPERVSDVIRLGVAARLAPFFDIARLPVTSAVARFDGESRSPSGGANAVRLIDAMYQRRLNQESAILAKEHPIHLHYTGRA